MFEIDNYQFKTDLTTIRGPCSVIHGLKKSSPFSWKWVQASRRLLLIPLQLYT